MSAILANCGAKLVWLVSKVSSSTNWIPAWSRIFFVESWPATAYAFLVSYSIASLVLAWLLRKSTQTLATWLESGAVCHMYGVTGMT